MKITLGLKNKIKFQDDFTLIINLNSKFIMFICICINCKFYSTCWINNALLNFPQNYENLRDNIKNFKRIRVNQNSYFYLPIMLEIQLNINHKNNRREPDIIFCDGFVEKPGNWLM